MVVLTEQIIKGKTRLDHLEDVKNLNLWGQDISDVSILEYMPNVEILSLSVNRIRTLRDFGRCPRLQELYLRKNEVADLQDLHHLTCLRNLKVLWLSDNPCASHPDYRPAVVQLLPALTKLDNLDITPQDREGAANLPPLQQQQQQQQPPPEAAWQQQHSKASSRAHTPPDTAGAASGRVSPASTPSSQPTIPPLYPSSSSAAPQALAAAAPPPHRSYSSEQDQPPGIDLQPHRSRPGSATGATASLAATAAPIGHALPLMTAVNLGEGASQEGSQRPASAPRGSKNVLYAVMSLLSELSAEELRSVELEVQHRLDLLAAGQRG